MASPLIYAAHAFLLGTSAAFANLPDDEEATPALTGDAVPRENFRHHTFQRTKDVGVAENPVILIQVALMPESLRNDDTDWTTIHTLNDAAPVAFSSNAVFPYVRALKSGTTAGAVRVSVYSGNNRTEN